MDVSFARARSPSPRRRRSRGELLVSASRGPRLARAGAGGPTLSGEIVSTFSNPIAPGADPWVIWHEGAYFWCASVDAAGVAVHRSDRLTELGEKHVVWQAPSCGPHCGEIWAPELHRIDGRWYIYVAASSGRNETHRMIVLEATSDDPTGTFVFKSELYTGDDVVGRTANRWAIDGTILDHGGERFLLWSGWEDDGDHQWLYAARMENAWTIATNRVRLAANDDHLWERVDETPQSRGLNEAPQVLVRQNRVFIVYSAGASWLPTYKLGLLELQPGAHPLAPGAWSKRTLPVFESTASVWGVGHCGFTRSPDGAEDWIVYHAKLERAPNWKRAVHAQRFDWSATGEPVFGRPTAAGIALPVPGRGQAEASVSGISTTRGEARGVSIA